MQAAESCVFLPFTYTNYVVYLDIFSAVCKMNITVRQSRLSGHLRAAFRRHRATMILLDYWLFDRTVLVKAEAALAGR